MINVFAQFADSSSGIGALGIDGQSFVIQLITFVLVILVLRKWAVKPILKVLNERRETIENGVKIGEQMKKDQAELKQKAAQTLHEARTQADKILSDAQTAGRQAIQAAEDAARTKAEGILEAANERIKQDTQTAKKRLESELAALVADATEAIIHEKVDAKKDGSLIARALEEQKV